MMRTMVWVVVAMMTLGACATSGDDGGIADEQSEVRNNCPHGPDVNYVSRNKQTCSTIRFACEVGKVPFNNECGCGCAPQVTCIRTGCSGQICASDEVFTTCDWREEYACYQTATCEPQANGQCGWTQTGELNQCISNAQSGGGGLVP